VQDDKVAAWFKEKRGIVLAIQRQPGVNTIEVVNSVRRLLPTFRAEVPSGINIDVLFDRSITIRASVAEVQFTLYLALAPEAGAISGQLFKDRKIIAVSAAAQRPEAATGLWRLSEQLVDAAAPRRGHGMVDVGLAGHAVLPFVSFGAEQVGTINLLDLIGLQVRFQHPAQVADQKARRGIVNGFLSGSHGGTRLYPACTLIIPARLVVSCPVAPIIGQVSPCLHQ